ncbi:MAG: MEDS domain-containing protein [Anaerolineales bacterium]|nr:MEDS domain-containing protein [Anaerolineales bacterium]
MDYSNLKPGDHLCCLYETEEEHRAVLTPFLREGLERGEKVVYIVDIRTAQAILDYLREDGLDVEPCLASGQLSILTRDDAYMREGVFDPDGMIALLRAETEQALAEDYPALRVTGEMTWALRGLPGSKRLIEYEVKLNDFLPGSQCLAICQYDRRRFDSEVLLDVLRTHPIAIVGKEVYDNFYYIPPDELLGGDLPVVELGHSLENLAERKRAEEALRDSRHMLQTVLDSIPAAVFWKDRDSIYLGGNRTWLEAAGLKSSEEVVGKSDYDLPWGKKQADSFREDDRRVMESGIPEYDIIEPYLRADGTHAWAKTNKVPLRDTGGNIVGILGTYEDITDRKQAEDALKEYSERLEEMVEERTAELNRRVAEVEQLNQAMGNMLQDLQTANRVSQQTARRLQEVNAELEAFAYSVSHDLRAPLRAISGFAQIIARRHRDSLNEEGQHYFDNIIEASAHMGQLIDDLLRYSRLGRTAVRRQPVPLGDLLARLKDELAGRVTKTGALLSLADDLPIIHGDPTLLGQIFINLLDNALTYHRTGVPPRIVVNYKVEANHVIVSVADNGIGIPPEFHEKIFDIFQRLHSQDEYPGIGLGLAIVKKATELLGGSVWVESVVGEGSTFYVQLPVIPIVNG